MVSNKHENYWKNWQKYVENTTDNLAMKSFWTRGNWKDISTALKMIAVAKESINKKARIRETLNLSTDADSSTDTTVGSTKNTQNKIKN